jgi:hypothetical protein
MAPWHADCAYAFSIFGQNVAFVTLIAANFAGSGLAETFGRRGWS